MQILALPQAWCNSTPPNLSVSSHIFTSNLPSQNLNKLASNLYGEPGFFNSLRSVSTSKTSLRRCSGLVKVRCGEVKDDRFYMRRCVELARTAIGCTSPNPMVGCVIVKDGKIVGEGFHPKAGQPHAEVFALRDAGQLAENATAYVSLEPCNHYGRTPPCTEALIKAKVKKVVVGTVDPNPVVSSKGVDRLRDAGIDVAVGVEEELCKRLNEVFIHQMLTGKPFVTLRYSLSVNGCFLDQLGEGASESGGYYSQLLQEHDAVIVSASLMENLPRLASQEPGANQPLRIIVARTPGLSSIQIPGVAKETAPEVIVFSNQDADLEAEMAQKGIETVGLDQVTLNAILEYCKSRGLCSALLDLRGSCGDLEELLKEGIDQNLLQKVVVEVLPQWDINDNVNLHVALNGLGKILKMKNLHPKISDQSIVLEGYL